MDQQQTRSRPACGSTDYVFKGWKRVPTEPGQAPAIETKYACRVCGHEWKVRVTLARGAGRVTRVLTRRHSRGRI
jgi:hypothetical protein